MYKHYLQTAASWLTILFPVCIVAGSAVAETGMAIIAALFIIRSLVEKDWAWARESWIRCLFLIWIYMIARGIFAENPQEALRRSLPFIRYFAFAAALAFWTLRDEATARRFYNFLTTAVLFLAADGLLQWLTGRDVFFRPVAHLSEGTPRLTGPYRNPILGIMLAWLSFPACLRFVMGSEGKCRLGLGIAVLLLVIAVTALSGERMALLLTFFGWGIAVFLMPKVRVYLLSLLAAGLLLIGALAVLNQGLFDRQILSTVSILENWHESPYGRLLDTDMKVARIDPVFGIGANHFRIVCPRLYPQYAGDEKMLSSVCNLHPHNIYMEWLIEEGTIGFCLFIVFIGLVVKKAVELWPSQRTNPFFVGSIVAFTIRLLPFISSTTFFSPFGAPSFWMTVAIMFVHSVQGKENASGS